LVEAEASTLAPGKHTRVDALTPYNNEAPAPAEEDAAPRHAPPGDAHADGVSASPQSEGGTTNAPAETYIIPFDRKPKSSPRERIIFGAVFTDPRPNDYRLVFTGLGGDFNAAGSGTKSVTSPGIVRNNLSFYIDAKWDKKSAVTVKLELQKTADASVVRTETWSFRARV
jgi:hypothetical protein